jgi:CHAT domain-containing protein
MMVLTGDSVISAAAAADASAADRQMAEGLKAYQRGAFEGAAVSWTEAARSYEQAGKRSEQSEALVRLSQAYQGLGHYTKALESLQSASSLIEQTGDRLRLAEIRGNAANLYLATGQMENASKYLTEGLQLARESGNQNLAALTLNNVGNLLASQKKYKEAVGAYQESLSLAQAVGNKALAARALINESSLKLQIGQAQDAQVTLDRAFAQVRELEDSHDKAFSLITIGQAYGNLRPSLPDSKEVLVGQALQAFNDAAKVAVAIQNPRAESYAWGHLGALYESERRYEEALDLTRRAVLKAQQAVAPEALYRWHWQTGRLKKAMGKRDEAITAYRQAAAALQSIRPEVALALRVVQSSFRESAGPVYFELADLLLLQAAAIPERKKSEPYLLEARDTIEQFKVAELRDYFRDECVDAARSRSKGIESLSKSAAVVYPILLPDRMELLVSLSSGLKRVSVPVTAETLTQEVRVFRKKVEKRTTLEYLPHAQQLYNWLIRPLEPVLKGLPIDTLVFVPDGPLRTIPMAALHDGKQFLIGKYAVATTPGLTLTDARPLKRGTINALSVGLTEAVQNFSPLPNVSQELKAIQGLYPGTLLLNKDFVVTRMEKELKEGRFTILHIASHGQMEGDPRKSFLLAFDGKLTMDKLTQAIGLLQFRDEPLELLTLSACQTAAGDDRAALGLAGVAIKAGAVSALATLWFINDQASSELVSEFYRQLKDSSVTKAVALQRAQLKLLDDPAFDHPAFWSPFLLLNNWL